MLTIMAGPISVDFGFWETILIGLIMLALCFIFLSPIFFVIYRLSKNNQSINRKSTKITKETVKAKKISSKPEKNLAITKVMLALSVFSFLILLYEKNVIFKSYHYTGTPNERTYFLEEWTFLHLTILLLFIAFITSFLNFSSSKKSKTFMNMDVGNLSISGPLVYLLIWSIATLIFILVIT